MARGSRTRCTTCRSTLGTSERRAPYAGSFDESMTSSEPDTWATARYSADSVRWFLIASSPTWKPKLFDVDAIAEVQRKFFGTLLNTYAFFALYANIDGFTHKEPDVAVSERPEIDRWILSLLNTTIGSYIEAMESYDPTRAARLVSNITIEQLSNWYVRRNRRRFWKSDPGRPPAGPVLAGRPRCRGHTPAARGAGPSALPLPGRGPGGARPPAVPPLLARRRPDEGLARQRGRRRRAAAAGPLSRGATAVRPRPGCSPIAAGT